MVYITGDTHGEQGRFFQLSEAGEATWTEEDILIVCGDFGFIYADSAEERIFLNELEKKPYTICFCDGNHENFPAIYSYPCEQWNGGKIHRIRKNVLHLMRGQIFTIDGQRFFTMGGAYSRDKEMRIEGRSWWREELPNGEEYREAIANLEKCGKSVDYVITHTAPKELILRMGRYPDPHDAQLTGFFDWILYEIEYKQWFFGHWHTDAQQDQNHRALWFDVVRLGET